MPIAEAHRAGVPHGKITRYLLDESHPVGGSKARWLIHAGYRPDCPEQLVADLIAIVRSSDVWTARETRYGVRYEVTGMVRSPTGRDPLIRTIWIVESGQADPRFVTAYPLKRRSRGHE
jgi:hypothetical protein